MRVMLADDAIVRTSSFASDVPVGKAGGTSLCRINAVAIALTARSVSPTASLAMLTDDCAVSSAASNCSRETQFTVPNPITNDTTPMRIIA